MLKQFFESFSKANEDELVKLWNYSTYETKFGTREEIAFMDKSTFLQKMPTDPLNEVSLLVINTKEQKVYGHARYLVQQLFVYCGRDELFIRLHGYAQQAVIPLKHAEGIAVEEVYAKGTIEHVDRFNNHSEKEVSKLSAIVLRRA